MDCLTFPGFAVSPSSSDGDSVLAFLDREEEASSDAFLLMSARRRQPNLRSLRTVCAETHYH